MEIDCSTRRCPRNWCLKSHNEGSASLFFGFWIRDEEVWKYALNHQHYRKELTFFHFKSAFFANEKCISYDEYLSAHLILILLARKNLMAGSGSLVSDAFPLYSVLQVCASDQPFIARILSARCTVKSLNKLSLQNQGINGWSFHGEYWLDNAYSNF